MKPDYFAILPDSPSVNSPEFPGLRLYQVRSQSGRRRLVANPNGHRYDPDSANLLVPINGQVMIDQPPYLATLWGWARDAVFVRQQTSSPPEQTEAFEPSAELETRHVFRHSLG